MIDKLQGGWVKKYKVAGIGLLLLVAHHWHWQGVVTRDDGGDYDTDGDGDNDNHRDGDDQMVNGQWPLPGVLTRDGNAR